MKAGNRVPDFPMSAMEWEGKLLFQFTIDADGRPVRGSTKVLKAQPLSWRPYVMGAQPPGTPSTNINEAFAAFRREVETALRRMQYVPAEYFGCRTATWVSQWFEFRLR